MRLKANIGIFHTISMMLISSFFLVLPLAGCYDSSMKDLIKLENVTPEYNYDGSPIPGNGGIITVSDITSSSVKLTWYKATDDKTPQNQLKYRVYYSNSMNIASVADIEAYGTPYGDWATDIMDISIYGLNSSRVYYFNVLVLDLEGEKASYSIASTTTAGGSGSLILFDAGSYTGNLTTVNSAAATINIRKNVDAICSNSALLKTFSCKNVKGFISVSETDSIKYLPSNYGIPVNLKIQGPTGTVIATNWFNLFQDIVATLQEAGAATSYWWSGSQADGSYESAGSCSGWTDGTNKSQGVIGAHNDKTYPTWLSKDTMNCNNSRQILCLCW